MVFCQPGMNGEHHVFLIRLAEFPVGPDKLSFLFA
jgi:hypothetical protein